jgi:hypothetical protein
MKLATFFVPLGVSLAVAGGIMVYVGLKPASAAELDRAAMANIVNEVRHPVSDQMLLQAKSMSERAAPFFKVKDVHGIDVQIGGQGKRPQFIYFILDGCPCSLDAQPLFNRMYQRYKDKVDFIGVINAGKEKALDYAGTTTTLHPIVCSENVAINKAFTARQSTYSLVVRSDGVIEKMWPGYSQTTLHELNTVLAKLTGGKDEPFDAAYAPQKMASGCYFW